MFLAHMASASFVETASSTGPPLRRCDLAAMMTGVSMIPQASLPSELPVQGAMITRSSRCFGPIGSTSGSVCQMGRPQIVSRRLFTCSAV